jgi:serine/threonine protein phosphatase PrpC
MKRHDTMREKQQPRHVDAAQSWHFDPVELVCEAGDRVNDDRSSALAASAWVLDGTTGLGAARLFPGASDAAWFAETADHLLRRLTPGAADAATLLQDLVRELHRECRRAALGALDGADVDLPAASLALVRLDGTMLETVMLGDCKILLCRQDGTIEALDHSSVAPFDAKVVAALIALQHAGETDPSKIKRQLARTIRENRRWKNRPGGYGVLADDPACLAFTETTRRPVADITSLLLMSDGFYRLVDTYRVMTPATLMAAALSRGLRSLYRELRQIEDADPDCLAHPRVKPRDDATGLLLRLKQT